MNVWKCIVVGLLATLLLGRSWAEAPRPPPDADPITVVNGEPYERAQIDIKVLADQTVSVTIHGGGLPKPIPVTLKPLPKERMHIAFGKPGKSETSVGAQRMEVSSDNYSISLDGAVPLGIRAEGAVQLRFGTEGGTLECNRFRLTLNDVFFGEKLNRPNVFELGGKR